MYLPLFLLLAAGVASSQIVPQAFLSAVNAASLDSPVSPGAIVSVFVSGALAPVFPPAERISVFSIPPPGTGCKFPKLYVFVTII